MTCDYFFLKHILRFGFALMSSWVRHKQRAVNNSIVTSSVLLLGSSQDIFILMRMLFTRTDQAGPARDYRILFDYPQA